MIKNQNGNVFVYILIAVVLFGSLMFALSRSASQDDPSTELAEGQVKIAVNEIIAYAASTSNTITQMQQTGATTDQIDFMLPSDTDFNTAPTIYKIFHPDGGGLNYRALPKGTFDNGGAGLAPGYYVGRFNNIEWTPTSAQDTVFTAYDIHQDVCEAINYKITRSTTIPTASGSNIENFFVFDDLHSGSNVDFMVTNCAACEDIPALCVTNGSGKYVFYSILEAE